MPLQIETINNTIVSDSNSTVANKAISQRLSKSDWINGKSASLHHKNLGRLAIHATSDDSQIGKGPMPYLLCEDIKQTISELRTKGITVSDPTREGESPWFCDMQDIDGNFWEIEEK